VITGSHSLRTRIILVLLVGLIVSNLIGFFVYTGDRATALLSVTGSNNAARIVSVVQSFEKLEDAQRQSAACTQSGPGLAIVLSSTAMATGNSSSRQARSLRLGLRDFFNSSDIDPFAVVEYSPAISENDDPFAQILSRCVLPAYRSMREMMGSGRMMQMSPQSTQMMQHWFTDDALLVSYRLQDGAWLNILTRTPQFQPIWRSRFLLAFLVIAAGIALLSIWVVRQSTEPLALLAGAAERLGRNVNAPDLPENGPGEVQKAARAFNQMKHRLRRLITDRTRILAAISHDLRTPITRLRLRAEFVEDDEQRGKMLDDLAQMESMISATLAFARLDSSDEKVQSLDLAGLIYTVCDDAAELGRNVSYEGPDHAPLSGRAIALRRVLENLVDNAVKYGNSAVVRLEVAINHDNYLIYVDDEGPGIPEEMMGQVFEPFHRIESSRNRETGGVGLGLAVVRSIIQGHGGNVTLANRPEGGLRVTVELPKSPGTNEPVGVAGS